MISSIHINNFQSHKSTKVSFDNGVNVIIGPSDSGKTAVIRALNWVINTKPTGDSFISKWATESIVTVELKNGDVVTRGKSKTDNYYMLNDAEFRAFGQDVPPEIREAFNVNELNTQFQMDAPFLLSNGSGEVAQILNKAVNLDVIDRSVSNIRKKKLDTDKELKFNENRLVELEQQITSFQYISDMEKDVALIEQLSKSFEYAITRKGNLKALSGRIQEGERKLSEISAILQAETALQSIFVKNSCLDSFKERKQILEDISTKILDLTEESDKYYDILSAEKEVDRIMKLNEEREQLIKKSSLLVNLTSVMKTKEDELLSLRDSINEVQDEFDQMMPEQCPLCGR